MWKQRKIVLLLKKYTERVDIDVMARYITTTRGVHRVDFVRWVLKKLYGIDVDKVDDTNFPGWQDIRSLLEESIEDGYIIQKDDQTDLSLSLLKLSSKGWKLTRWQYFYFKYLPEEFGDLKVVLITMLATLATSSLLKVIYHWFVGLFTRN